MRTTITLGSCQGGRVFEGLLSGMSGSHATFELHDMKHLAYHEVVARVPHLLWCECHRKASNMRTEQMSIKGSTIRAAEILFKVLLPQAGQGCAVTVLLDQKRNNVWKVDFCPGYDLGA